MRSRSLRSSPPALLPLESVMLSYFFREQGNGEREPRENRGREREPRENNHERTAERELGIQEGKPNEGKPRGMTGEYEKPNEGNDRGTRGNQMTVE
jgi:hypothetical protein